MNIRWKGNQLANLLSECWWVLLIAKDTTDDNSINPVSPLAPSLPIPLFSQSFYRWKAPTFSVNGLQSSELNIDSIGSLVVASVTTRCSLKNTKSHREPRREGWRRWEKEHRELERRERGRGKSCQEANIKMKERRQTGDIGSWVGRQGNTGGDEKKEQGTRQAAIKRGRRERNKGSAVDEAQLSQNRKGKGFFEVNVRIFILPATTHLRNPPSLPLLYSHPILPHSHHQ